MKNPLVSLFALAVLVAAGVTLWVFNRSIPVETGQDSGQQS